MIYFTLKYDLIVNIYLHFTKYFDNHKSYYIYLWRHVMNFIRKELVLNLIWNEYNDAYLYYELLNLLSYGSYALFCFEPTKKSSFFFLNLLYKNPLLISSPHCYFWNIKKIRREKGKKKRKERFLILVVGKNGVDMGLQA